MKITVNELQIDKSLYDFVNNIIATTNLDREVFWQDFSEIITTMTPENLELLSIRDKIQYQIDDWHKSNPEFNKDVYKSFLKKIGYLEVEQPKVEISTTNVDEEIKQIAGPQLVVPVSNPRYAINAVNARWGSLYDAFYGTDLTKDAKNKILKIFELTHNFLDTAVPFITDSYNSLVGFNVTDNKELVINLKDGRTTKLKNPDSFVGFSGSPVNVLLLKNNNLHIEIQLDKNHQVGSQHPAGIKDVLLESAITTILDMEDSVATVSAMEKINNYNNLLGLINNTLSTTVKKAGKNFKRTLKQDREYTDTNGNNLVLSARSLMLIRNVGLHMFTDIILTKDNKKTPEGILDAMISGLIAVCESKLDKKNSKAGSCYIVKPKMHGSKEVSFTVKLFARVEQALNLAKNTLKVGIMDEERRTSVNLRNCIYSAKDRVVFINTGFLDRTADEIRTSMFAGAMLPKDKIKKQKWLKSYEDNNVKSGLDCGFSTKAQIGKGMWPAPDQMSLMMQTKIAHPQAGANCAWVPSPTAATLHATHYHQINVFVQQEELLKTLDPQVDDILIIPLLGDEKLSYEQIQQELDNNIQGILGYVVHWIDTGVGCSKVPDINNVELMEDRATLRISSQHVANWLKHKICSKEQVEDSFKRMAKVVDEQNKNNVDYINMSSNTNNTALLAAKALVFEALEQPNGYTEMTLFKYRKTVLVS